MALLPSGFSAAGGAYQIQRSLRFNSADSAYLNRTPGVAGNQLKYTISFWAKITGLGSGGYYILGNLNASALNGFGFLINSSNQLNIFDFTSAYNWQLQTTQVFRDPSSWYHIVFAYDSANATAANRAILYINGTQVTAFSVSNYPSSSFSSYWNNTSAAAIGRSGIYTSSYYAGYLTEFNFIDGQALTPSSFGQTNPSTGVWQPIKYTGTYGTNGFYLNFSDNSGTTATTLGKDSSGNGNNWTPNNFSVTAGVGNDSLVDTPTPYGSDTGAGGEVRGNYCTLNPLAKTTTSVAPTNGNLEVTTATTGGSPVFGTLAIPASGKWYWEVVCTSIAGNAEIGVSAYYPNAASGSDFLDSFALALSYYSLSGNKILNTANTAYGATYTTNDVIGIAVDVDGGTVTFYKNNVSQGAITYSSAGLFPAASDGAGAAASTFVFNFGQRPFAYTAPSGYKALCTQNLPTPTIGATSTTQALNYFDVRIWTGPASGQPYTPYSDLQFAPDFWWGKCRGTAGTDHILQNTVQGAGTGQALYSNSTQAAGGQDAYGYVSTFGTNGVSLSSTGGGGDIGIGSRTMVAWQWNAGGSNATNTSGTITSTVRANTTAGFSIATFTQLSGSPYVGTVGHGLGVAPDMVIIKDRSIANGWLVYHSALGATKYLVLNTTAAATTGSNAFNNTAPTSTVFTTAAGSTYWGNAGATAVGYCFAPVAGYSAFGSYTGNGSADGPFVYTGFRPRYVLIKRSDTGGTSWVIRDTSRDPYNATTQDLYTNLADAETASNPYDILSNGFKIRFAANWCNANGGTYVYAAFAESPFKYSLAR